MCYKNLFHFIAFLGISGHFTCLATDDMTYALSLLLLLLPVVAAAAVMVRAYDNCHVTSVKSDR